MRTDPPVAPTRRRFLSDSLTLLAAAPFAAPGVAASPSYEDPPPADFVPGSFTLVLLPDTQHYSETYPQHFYNQTDWIARNVKERNIKYVLHLGDITNRNSFMEWQVARAAMSRLHGKVPYALVPGNHDYGPGGNASTRDTQLNGFFPLEQYRDWPTFGGVMEAGRIDNSFHRFEANGEQFLIIALEWGPRNDTVAWADQLAGKYADRRAILLTHAFVYSDDTRYDWARRGASQSWNPHAYPTAKLPGGVNDGEELWQKLVRRHANFMLTVNGHVLNDGLGRLAEAGNSGAQVHQTLVNYQMLHEGGDGYLRLMEFHPDGKRVQVKAYSPSLDRYLTDPQNQFVLTLNPALRRA